MADFGTLEAVDNFSGVRNALRHLSEHTGDWAGIPMPLDGERLVIEPNFPMAEELSKIGAPPREEDPPGVVVRNVWWSKKLRREVYVWQEPDGRILGSAIPGSHDRLRMSLHTLGCAVAWGIEQEANAVKLLGTLLSHHKFKTYMLTGMFLETSKRSGLTYLFRRLKPTVVIDARDDGRPTTRILAALCMHPIAYYERTWAGAMTPTDDVVAHLMMMRGDEHMYWKRSTQHQPGRPEAEI